MMALSQGSIGVSRAAATMLAVIPLLVASITGARAQESQRALHGVITDTHGRRIPFANVVFGVKRAVADDSGNFRMAVPAGERLDLEFRRLGFAPVRLTLNELPDSAIRVALPPLPQRIQEQVITAEQPRGFDRTGFYERMKHQEKWGGSGHFITPEDIERRNYPKMTRLFEGLTSVRIIPGGTYFGGIPTSTHNPGCTMQTYLDGSRLEVFPGQDPKNPYKRNGGMVGRILPRLYQAGGSPGMYPGLDNFISTTTVKAIEVYPRATSAPMQYQAFNADCGVILIWTK